MKIYNKVYVEDKKGEYRLDQVKGGSGDDWGNRVSLFLAPIDSTIVLTLEELRELWEAAKEYIVDEEMQFEYGIKNTSPDFETYLTSKGITLDGK